jgi:protoporphyrinogen oxidase
MPEDEVYRTPVKVLLEYVHKTVGTDHYTPAPGHSARTIAEKLAASVKEQGKGYVRLGNAVKRLKFERGEVVVQLSSQPGIGEEDIRVDRVVLATPASVAGALLGLLEDSIQEAGEDEAERLRIIKSALRGVRYKVSPTGLWHFSLTGTDE